MNAGSTQAELGLAHILVAREKPDEARKYLEMTVKTGPLNGAAHNMNKHRAVEISPEAG